MSLSSIPKNLINEISIFITKRENITDKIVFKIYSSFSQRSKIIDI
jgi:hypothetical protein